MKHNDSLGDRMKTYEAVPKNYLVRRMPVAIRIDGCHFHTWTWGLQKPRDYFFMCAMIRTMEELCRNIQGCVFGYTQSDEITLILLDYQTLETSAWFDNQVQKICSVAASMATAYFNKNFKALVDEEEWEWKTGMMPQSVEIQENHNKLMYTLEKHIENPATFDARCFNIPKEEVTNLILWRQLDAERNSIQGEAQARYAQKQINGLSCKQLKEKMKVEKGFDWDKLYNYEKYGSCCYKQENGWVVDNGVPKLVGEARKLLDERIFIGD